MSESVQFVGAGSGAADLLTLRGKRLLEQADVVVWAGSLVNAELLSYCKETCEIYDSARLTLEETDAILRTAAQNGRRCVRLHTGDPALYGAIREQMERLDAAHVPYEVTPGVSSLFAASAALKKELTVPEVSQTVIISRMEGRTPVPARERVRSLAAHGATMVLFLSVGALPALVAELLSGGAYTGETPCAVVYKASWPDERVVRGTLSDIAEKTAAAGITKTALVLVGDFLGDCHAESRLYDRHFSTAFRTASCADGEDAGLESETHGMEGQKKPVASAFASFSRVAVACFSEQGKRLAERIAGAMPPSVRVATCSCYGETHAPLSDFCREQFARSHEGERVLVVFVGAAGIAVRSCAPFIESKRTDPAVVCIDDAAHFVIPLLSGHLGGANAAARALSALTGATAAITTATDANGAWAIDSWAVERGWHIPDMALAKRVCAAVLAGRRVLCLGVGCRRGCDAGALEAFVRSVLAERGLPGALVGAVASIDLKREEKAVRSLAASFSAPFATYRADELNAARGAFTASDFVRATTGCDSVAERAAVLAAGTSADWLLVRKTARDGMTVAVAVGWGAP